MPKISKDRYQSAVTLVAFASLLASITHVSLNAGITLNSWLDLLSFSVPCNFNYEGKPKEFAPFFVYPAVTVFVYFLLVRARRLSKTVHRLNMYLCDIQLGISPSLTVLQVSSLWIGRGLRDGLPTWFVPLLITYVGIVTSMFLYYMYYKESSDRN